MNNSSTFVNAAMLIFDETRETCWLESSVGALDMIYESRIKKKRRHDGKLREK